MCTSGTPTVYLGGPSRNFQAKNQYVVVPLSATLDMVYAKIRYVVFAWDIVGFGD